MRIEQKMQRKQNCVLVILYLYVRKRKRNSQPAMIPAHIRSLALTVPWLQHHGRVISSPEIFPFIKTKIQLQQRKGQWQDWNNMEEDISDVSDNINDERNEQGENEVQERRYPDRNEQGENEVQERRYPERDRRPINRYGQNIYE